MSAPRALLAGALALGAGVFAYQQTQGPAPIPPLKNAAFVFVKPHAVTDKVTAVVRDVLASKGITILAEGDLTSEVIDEKKLIDQHYYSIASKATILKPEEINVPADKFKAQFGVEYADVLKDKKAYNALDACKAFGLSAVDMKNLWDKAKKENKLVKLGGGFYCGQLPIKGQTVYVFNGFFMEMRNAFTAPGRKIHYYSVEWDPSVLSWADFRGKVLGPTDPKDAPPQSLRGHVLKNWKDLGLKSEPNVGDNAVHASASPFEGMAERMNWLGVKCAKDTFCSALVAAGLPESTIRAWSVDPQIIINTEGKKGSTFDAVEDLDANPCAEKIRVLQSYQKS